MTVRNRQKEEPGPGEGSKISASRHYETGASCYSLFEMTVRTQTRTTEASCSEDALSRAAGSVPLLGYADVVFKLRSVVFVEACCPRRKVPLRPLRQVFEQVLIVSKISRTSTSSCEHSEAFVQPRLVNLLSVRQGLNLAF